MIYIDEVHACLPTRLWRVTGMAPGTQSGVELVAGLGSGPYRGCGAYPAWWNTRRAGPSIVPAQLSENMSEQEDKRITLKVNEQSLES